MAAVSLFTRSLGGPATTWLVTSLVAGLTYPLVEPVLPPAAAIGAKGLGVGLLAVAALHLPTLQRGWLAAIMTAGAVGDVLLELPGLFYTGAAAFAGGHIAAMLFYSRHRATDAAVARRLGAAALIGWGLAMPGLVSPPGTAVGALMLYSVMLCGMAAALLLSRFPVVALVGALLFVVSDTLLIMRLGGNIVSDASVHGWLVWISYYLGQALIFVGVGTGLVTQTSEPR